MTFDSVVAYLYAHPEVVAMGLTALVNLFLSWRKPQGKIGQAVAEAFGGGGIEPVRVVNAVKSVFDVFKPEPPPAPPADPEVKK